MRILFVCTGNTCRSPMAEGLLRKLASERGVNVEVSSAGVAASEGAPISRHAEAVLKDQGIMDFITSKPLYEELTDWADLILTLTQGHKRHVIQRFPAAADKTYTLKEYVEDDKAVLNDQEELHQLIAELELSKVLGKELSDIQTARLTELLRAIPTYDISDPFGGSRSDYDMTAGEISAALVKLLDKMMREGLL
ncbi:low molecular weight protein arginine phosphatase [Paenibacillus anaericanus]|uniref:Low molecular weight protein arginine phosphatase n=1 Tax=Paenibacillus anaericanus TaxID=170367 RepID=A0A3S1BHI7_9BACL|nr:low molecular weight protein arginine phosphatase [Paenibacillus anaericanus]RUT41760.1 low molecular weight protein arginine phosphatase [Paenibacillus anaericanus]